MYGIEETLQLQPGQMWQVDLAAAQHLLSPFSSPFFGVKFLDDYGLWFTISEKTFLALFSVCFLKALDSIAGLTNFLFLKFTRGETAG